MNVLENYIYIYHLDKFCVLPSMPDTINDQMNSSYNEQNALSRSAPVQSYINSGPRSITFTFDLHRDLMDDLNTGISNLKDNVVDFQDKDYIDVLINYLQACALPKYSIYKTGSKVVDPPQVAVRMGNDIFIRGVVSGGIGVTYQKPILDNGKYARVQITLPIKEVDPYDAPTVVMVGGFRGITSTFKNGIYKDDSDTRAYESQEFTKVDTNSNPTSLKKQPGIVSLTGIGPNGSNANTSITLKQKKVPGHNELWIFDFSDTIARDARTGQGIRGVADAPWGLDTSPLATTDNQTKVDNSWHGYELAKRGNYH